MCDSSQHNFASARLDHTTYGKKIQTVRSTLVTKVLDRIFAKWLEEYNILKPQKPATLAALRRTEWLFAERGNTDVMKDASADNTRLGNGTTNYQTLYGKDGKDWKRETDQAVDEKVHILARWREKCRENGLPEDTPCPFFAKGGATSAAPTEDQVEHAAQRKRNNEA
jgi:hypothetical protein